MDVDVDSGAKADGFIDQSDGQSVYLRDRSEGFITLGGSPTPILTDPHEARRLEGRVPSLNEIERAGLERRGGA